MPTMAIALSVPACCQQQSLIVIAVEIDETASKQKDADDKES